MAVNVDDILAAVAASGGGAQRSTTSASDPLVFMGRKSTGAQATVWTGPDGQQHLGAPQRPTVWTRYRAAVVAGWTGE